MSFETLLEEIQQKLAYAQELAQAQEHEQAAWMMKGVSELAEDAARRQLDKAEALEAYRSC